MIKMTAATHDDDNSDKDYDNKENTHDHNKDPSLLLLLGPTTMMKIRINRATNNQLIIVMYFHLFQSKHARTHPFQSFILNIYIAPLQESYSEALPSPARLKTAV